MPAENSLIPSSIFGSARSSLTSSRDYKATVQLLDDNETIFQEFKKNANAQVILDYVCEFLNIVEKDYFGLRCQDISKHRYWIDLNKPISKQIRGPNVGLRFRVRFYPSDVSVLKEEITRYQLFVQLQRDLLHGRLYCPQSDAAHLGALILQSVVGDYDAEVHEPGYVSQYKLLLKQTAKLEERIADAHKTFKGLTAAEAEMEFLKRASKLDTYGFDPYTVVDKQGQTMYLGVTHRGIYIYHVSRMIHHISWDELKKVDYLGKELFVTPIASYVSPYTNSDEINGNEKHSPAANSTPLKFHCPSAKFAKHLWRHILSQQAFFTENDAKHIKPKFSKPRIPLLSRGSTFRFPTSRVLHEIEAEGAGKREGPQPCFTRYTLQKQPPRQLLTFTSKYHTLPPMHLNNSYSTTIPENDALEESGEQLAVHSVLPILEEELQQTVDESLIVPESPASSTVEHVCETEETSVEQKTPEDLGLSESSMAPLFTSTPMQAVEVNERQTFREKHSPPPVYHEESAQNCSSASALSSAAKFFFSCLLVLLLFTALAIAFFESQPAWLDSYEALDDLRHSVYEPMRRAVISSYDNLGRR